MSSKEILKQIEKDNVKFIQLQFTDLFGVVKSVTIPASHLEETLKYGSWFDGSSIEGFARIAESDMFLRPDESTYGVIPWLRSNDGNTARFICDVYTPDGEPFSGDPRYILKKIMAKAEKMGYEFKTGPEMEFFLFKKEDGIIQPLPHDRAGYFDLTTDEAYEVRRDMALAIEELGIHVETSHHEVAQGQHEIDFRYDNALKTADSAITIKTTLKAIAQKHGLHATFMPKPIAGINGSGMHVHQSLFDISTGKNAFYDGKDQYKLSKTAYSFIAGQLQHIKAMSAILSPTVNSYKRLIPGYEAPVYLSWAAINRSALIRVPRYSEGKNEATRIELRCPDPTCNIYLAFAVMLTSGLEGIEKNFTPPKPVEEDIYHLRTEDLQDRKIEQLPGSLIEALQEMKKDGLVKNTLGQSTFERYITVKNAEWDEFRLQVTEWELNKYLEIY